MNETSSAFSDADPSVWVGNGGALTGSYLGLRFNNVAIPPGAYITEAHLEFYSTTSQWISIGAAIRAQAVDNALAFSSVNKPSQMTTGSEVVNHTSDIQWNTDTWYTFQDGLSSVVQEVISRPGWQNGSSLALVIQGTSPGQWGRKFFRSFEGGANQSAKLVISYSTGGSCSSGFTQSNGVTAQDDNCTCQNNIVKVISQSDYQAYVNSSPDKIQELKDMVIVRNDGVALMAAPTINSPFFTQYGAIWDSQFTVYERVEFSQMVDGLPDKQIWYHIGVNSPDAWMVVRYDGISYLVDDDPCFSAQAPDILTFRYDRHAAARYAIVHSYDTLTNFNVLEPNGRVTQNLHLASLPYAYFKYDTIDNSQGTGSAVFVSEAMWMGGLPMTYGDIDTDPSQLPNTDSCWTAGGATSGWRYCYTDINNQTGKSSNPWDTHEDLFGYWVNTLNSVLSPTNKGKQFLFPGLGAIPISSNNTQTIWGGDTPRATTHDLSTYNGNLVMGDIADGVVVDAAGLSNRIKDLLTADPNNPPVKMGDYIYINTDPTHGLLVVGWQEALSCAIAYQGKPGTGQPPQRWAANDFGLTYDEAKNQKGIANPVPYVADFTSPDYNTPTPRPFYCTRHINLALPQFFSVHNWTFFTPTNPVTDSVTIPYPPASPNALDRLYVDPNWQWSQ